MYTVLLPFRNKEITDFSHFPFHFLRNLELLLTLGCFIIQFFLASLYLLFTKTEQNLQIIRLYLHVKSRMIFGLHGRIILPKQNSLLYLFEFT